MPTELYNWHEGANPFKLRKPSQWWLQLIWDYDPQLVVMPSCREHAYRLCRRVRMEARLGLSKVVHHNHPDTIQMIQIGCVPIATMPVWAIESPNIVRELRSRDTWLQSGGKDKSAIDKLVDKIERAEAEREDKEKYQAYERLDQVSGEAFRSMQFRNGSAVYGPGAVTRLAKTVQSRLQSPSEPGTSGTSRADVAGDTSVPSTSPVTD